MRRSYTAQQGKDKLFTVSPLRATTLPITTTVPTAARYIQAIAVAMKGLESQVRLDAWGTRTRLGLKDGQPFG